MKTQIKLLKERLDQYEKPLSGCELFPRVQESLEVMIDLNLTDNEIKKWIVDNRKSLIIIENKIKELSKTN